MKIYKGFENLSPGRFRSPVMTLGTFDGVHLGHKAVICEVIGWAEAAGRESLVLTFSTHPRSVVCGHTPRSIMPLHERLARFSRLGVESAVVLEFDENLAAMNPETFCREVLAGTLGTSGVALGHNARFGAGRRGDAALLELVGPPLGIEVRQCPPVLMDGSPVSSSAIRKAIEEGDLAKASSMLGRPPELVGEVVRGRGLGRGLGWPTANLSLSHGVKLPDGVWRGRVCIDDRPYPCVISLGKAPTFGADLPDLVEVHVIGFEGDLLGADLKVEVTGHLREQVRFAGVSALVEAIRGDVSRALALHEPDRGCHGKGALAAGGCGIAPGSERS